PRAWRTAGALTPTGSSGTTRPPRASCRWRCPWRGCWRGRPRPRAAPAGGGGSSACALDSTGAAYCWGDNTYGELGNNSTTQANVPVTVSVAGVLAGGTLIQITGGNSATRAVDRH